MSAVLETAENSILGAILSTSGAALDEIHLTPDDFAEPARGDLFGLMAAMWSERKPVDAFTISEAHPQRAVELYRLTSLAAPVSSIGYYAEVIKKHALRRRLAAVGAGFATLRGDDPATIADGARAALEAAIGDTSGGKVRYVTDFVPTVLERMNAKDVFVPSPWRTLNAAIGGFRPGAVYVVAARPGIGKTVIAAQIAARLAEEGKVAFASLEMTGEELVARLMSERLQINVGHIKNARMTDHDRAKLAQGRATLDAMQIAIDDRSGISASDVRTFARAVARDGRLAGVVVDYMQLMTTKLRMDRHLQVADFSRQLKILAKDFRIPVIALSQLNRNSDATSLSVPRLSDLRESGAIEQDADVVMLLRREGDFPNERIIIDVAKNRHGETGEVNLSWDGGYSRAVEWGNQ